MTSILVAGDWRAPMHEAACYDALCQLGCDAVPFAWGPYLEPRRASLLGSLTRLAGRAQNKYLVGPSLTRLNKDLAGLAIAHRPQIIFIYRGTHVHPGTLEAIKERLPDTLLVSYANDDPFSPHARPYTWRHFLSGLRCYDLHFAYRPRNVSDYLAAGARHVHLLRSYYIPHLHYPVSLTAEDRRDFESDVVFAGHYEPDDRQTFLESLMTAGINLKLFGPEWDRPARQSPVLSRLGPIRAARDDAYRKAICGSKIALCFLSALNRDTYTRRCFEIPAMGTFLLARYTEDLASLFREGVDAEFFRSEQELIDKVRFYLARDGARKRIAAAGRDSVRREGHDVTSRMRQALQIMTGHIDGAPSARQSQAALC